MNTQEGTESGGQDLQNGLRHEAREVRNEAQLLEDDAREAERETLAHSNPDEIPPELASLFAVLAAAGTLVRVAKEGLSVANTGSDVNSQLRSAVDGATKIVNQINTFIGRYLSAGSTDTLREKEQKSGK
jgi:hypothetical protein